MYNHKTRWLSALVMLALIAPAFTSGASYAQNDSRTFTETGKTVSGRFLQYWNANGGLAQQGYPISEEMQEKSDTDGKTYTVQYFERAVFERHTENKAPFDVLLSLLGNFLYQQKYAGNAPNQVASTENARKFNETGKTVGGKFRAYWEANGGLAQQGLPISNEFTEKNDLNGKTYKVQYFERAVFELHPENAGTKFEVLLSQLGKFRYDQKYANSAEVKVDIVDFAFNPKVITVKVGTKVTWTQVGPTIHNTVSKQRVAGKFLWESPIMEKGEKYSYIFTQAGTYDYLCTLHPEMVAQVIVK